MKTLLKLIIVVCTTTLFSCKKENVKTNIEPIESIKEVTEVSVENGYLVFGDKESFDKYNDNAIKLSNKDLEKLEQQYGYRSARTYLEKRNDDIRKMISKDELQPFLQKYQDKLHLQHVHGILSIHA